jgi:hypothetical protein
MPNTTTSAALASEATCAIARARASALMQMAFHDNGDDAVAAGARTACLRRCAGSSEEVAI